MYSRLTGLDTRMWKFSTSYLKARLCGQSSWLQVRRPGFYSRRYQIFWEVMGLERGPLSLVSATEELRGRKSSGSGLQNREYGRRDPSRWPRGTLYPQKLTITSPTSSCRSVGIVRSRTQTMEFSLVLDPKWIHCSLSYQYQFTRMNI
jgi:hypothetical protein